MSKIININDHEDDAGDTVEVEAAAWVVRIQDAPLEGNELREFQTWLQKSPAHKQAFEHSAGTWKDLDQLPEAVFSELGSARASTEGIFRHRFAATVCVLSLFFLGSLLAWKYLPDYPETQTFAAVYSTEIGELKEITLPDGSGMQLNTNSKTNISFKKDTRIIQLIDGEAHFNVHHDADKPFVVYVDNVAITAIGTAFSVYRKEDKIDVIVTEGEVKIASFKEPIDVGDTPIRQLLKKADTVASFVEGQRAVFNEQIELVERIESEEIEKKLSWRNQMLIFDGDRLEDAVEQIRRYTPKKIVILDSSIRDLKIGGYFRAGDIDLIFDTFEQTFGINVEAIEEDLVYLSKK